MRRLKSPYQDGTTHIVMSALEFMQRLAALVPRPRLHLMENPIFQCRFRWRANSIAFWDNRCVQHRAMWDYWPHA